MSKRIIICCDMCGKDITNDAAAYKATFNKVYGHDDSGRTVLTKDLCEDCYTKLLRFVNEYKEDKEIKKKAERLIDNIIAKESEQGKEEECKDE